MLAPNQPTAADLFRPRTTIDAEGTVEGYASLFGELDQGRDVAVPGAFRETLRLRGLRRYWHSRPSRAAELPRLLDRSRRGSASSGVTPVRPPQPAALFGPVDQLTTPIDREAAA